MFYSSKDFKNLDKGAYIDRKRKKIEYLYKVVNF